jgi:hypothetical protein
MENGRGRSGEIQEECEEGSRERGKGVYVSTCVCEQEYEGDEQEDEQGGEH